MRVVEDFHVDRLHKRIYIYIYIDDAFFNRTGLERVRVVGQDLD